ncbi:TPA: hypothetical protein N0F65_006992 [Lagenidium giganteum]|uniref:CSC1-like protein 2 n=1 Tax=Lagenidium giganteum TaxID=4803 RepID=A0AAV2ZHC4_9STRA|nr:TPA: hypothetical protein N0F65_006992 [Lagenidium giganteum]
MATVAVFMRLTALLWLWVWLSPASPVHAADLRNVVDVPTGITTVYLGRRTKQDIECDVLPGTAVGVQLTVIDGNNTERPALVKPNEVWFTNTDPAGDVEVLSRSIEIYGLEEGRFYLTYQLVGDVDRYRLGADSSAIVVTEPSQGWEGIWWELAFNMLVFLGGLTFFAWRRVHHVHLPIWQRNHTGLFERANFDALDDPAFAKRYHDIMGDSVRERMAKFWATPCDGTYVSNTCGIPAALSLRFHLDAGHLFALLTIFSVGAMLPVNYLSSNKRTTSAAESFQHTTFSNVPLRSEWYWAHVAYCYLVAIAVLIFLVRQNAFISALRRRSKRIVGGRSIFIQSGLPSAMTSKKLRSLLSEYYPDGIVEVTVIHDLTKLHHMLSHRRSLAQRLDRLRELDRFYEGGAMSCNMLWCPGSVMVPEPLEVVASWTRCRPCKYHARHHCPSQGALRRLCCCCCGNDEEVKRTNSPEYTSIPRSDRIVVDPEIAATIRALDEELDFFPEEAIESYENRKCSGAAFVTFDSPSTRNDFVNLIRGQSLGGRCFNHVSDVAYFVQTGKRRENKRRSSSQVAPHLSSLILTSAPEPDDVLWQNLEYRPFSFRHISGFLVRQLLTIGLLLLFSTPTAVLVYVKLDSSSGIYRDLYARHSVIVTMIASYLPSLLLIVVNWLLLNFLYHITMMEPSFSESRRMKSFLIKGFIYLVVSSVFLPCIGVTAVYLAFSGLHKDGKTYVESFLYKVSGTFFISYVCQRTFLGSIIELTRSAERLVYQPWVHSRSLTPEEMLAARKPWPYYFGHDYAVILSVFLVMLLGTMITPIITPFGAVYFYVKFFTEKYTFFYVVPYTPGRGHIAQSAYTIAFVCLVLLELAMIFVFVQVANSAQCIALIVLLALTCAFYFVKIAGMAKIIKSSLSELRADGPHGTRYQGSPTHARRTILSPKPTDLEQELGLVESYTDPYKVALSIFKLLGVNRFHQMSSTRTQLRYAFYRLKRAAAANRARQAAGQGSHDQNEHDERAPLTAIDEEES